MHFINAKGILTGNGGRCGMNIYRGCSHGCIYCDSRSLCYQFKHPFEDIEVKQNAPEQLEQALKSKRKKCMIGTGAMSDPEDCFRFMSEFPEKYQQMSLFDDGG